MRAVSLVDITNNNIIFTADLCAALAKAASGSTAGLVLQVLEGNSFDEAQNSMGYEVLQLLGSPSVIDEVNVESKGLSGECITELVLAS